MSAIASLNQSRLEALLFADRLRYSRALIEANQLRFQAIVSVLPPRGATGGMESHPFRADREYFYPASTVKLAAAAVAMDRLSDPDCVALGISEDSPMLFEPCYTGEQPESSDLSNVDSGKITLGHDSRHALIISDNTAHNRLFEFLGHDQLNRRLQEAGLASAAINHRLSEPHALNEQRRTPRVHIQGSRGTLIVPARDAPHPLVPGCISGLEVGRQHMDEGALVNAPMSFAHRNRLNLTDLHRLIVAIARPEVENPVRFNLPPIRLALLQEALRLFPAQSRNPHFGTVHPDEFVKPFLPGIRRVLPDSQFTLLNKIGWAYGFFTDTAYIEHLPSGCAIAITATVFVCQTGLVNNDDYQYDSTARPLFADLAETAVREFLLPKR